MRTVLFLIALSVAPGEYAAAASLQPPNCALGGTLPIKGVATRKAAAEQPAPPSVPVEDATPKQTAGPTAGLLSEAPDIDQVPVLKHISETGAKIFDLGTSHGLRGVIARLGEEFMLLKVAPDGQAVVAGLQSELSVSELLSIAGSQVTELGSAHGLRGIFVRDGAAFQVFYATSDVHMIVPGGGISSDGERWIGSRAGFLLPIRVLSKLFRRLFITRLIELHAGGKLTFFGQSECLGDRRAFVRHVAPLRRKKWHVYAKAPFAGPEAVLAYLSRYTHRVAISNRRLTPPTLRRSQHSFSSSHILMSFSLDIPFLAFVADISLGTDSKLATPWRAYRGFQMRRSLVYFYV